VTPTFANSIRDWPKAPKGRGVVPGVGSLDRSRRVGQRGSILVGVLWCVVVLSVIVVSVLHTSRQDVRLARHQGDVVQARYLALAGIERAKASLFEDLRDRRRAQRHFSDRLADAPQFFREIPLGRGRYSVIHPASTPREPRYGVADESGRLDINTASTNELLRLPGMNTGLASAIVDWRDPDSIPGPGGAEADQYAAMNPPVLPRNGPFRTPRELLMVRGVSLRDFNGDGSISGWANLLGVHASSSGRTAAGEARINVKTADERTLTGIRGFTPEIARAIIAHRSGNDYESLLDLLNVTATPGGGPGVPAGVTSGGRPGSNVGRNNSGGPRIISEDVLHEVADLITVGDSDSTPGRININSAPAEVLACLEGIDLPLAQAIVGHRQSIGGFPHAFGLVRVPGMTLEKLRPIFPRISADSNTWRIRAEGVVPDRDTRVRIEVIVRVDTSSITTLIHREDDL
jgi:DNA uptake protein ComE-like DNA-binding protein